METTEENDKNETSSSSFFKILYHQLHDHSGIWYMLTANFVFTCCIFALKLIPADIFDIMIVRFSIQSSVFGVFAILYKRYNVFNTNGQPIACALNILTSTGTNLIYLAALYFIPLSDLNTIKYTYIVWAAVLSVVFLKDRFKIVNVVSLFLTSVGLIFATKPHFLLRILSQVFDLGPLSLSLTSIATTTTNLTTTITTAKTSSSYYYLGISLASLSALTKAVQMIARKQLVKTKLPYSVMNFHFTFSALFTTIIYSIIRRLWHPEAYPWRWMCTAGPIIGCCQLLSNTFLAKALKRESVQLLSILDSLDIVIAVILQYIFLHQTKSWMFFIGALLIVLSAIILSIDRYFVNKHEKVKRQTNNVM